MASVGPQPEDDFELQAIDSVLADQTPSEEVAFRLVPTPAHSRQQRGPEFWTPQEAAAREERAADGLQAIQLTEFLPKTSPIKPSSAAAELTPIELFSPTGGEAASSPVASPSATASPAAENSVAGTACDPEANRSVFELTELDILRLRPFIHGVHVRVNRKRQQYIFGPESFVRRFWCLLRATFIITFMIMIPLRAAFTVRDTFPVTLILDYLIDLFFFLDFIAWNTVFSASNYSQGAEHTLIYRPRDISRYYRQWSGFWYDVLATIPFDYVFIPLGYWRVILWLRLTKLIRIPNLLSAITSVHPFYFRNLVDPVVKRMAVVFGAICQ